MLRPCARRHPGHRPAGIAAGAAPGLLLKSGALSGWRPLAGLSAAQVVSWGVLHYSFAVFVQPLELEMGWSRTETMGAFSLALLVSGLAAVPVGYWIDRRGTRGTRLLMASGTALAATLLVLLSTVGSLPAFYATWAGAAALALTGLMQLPGRIVFEPLRRRLSARTLLAVSLSAQAAGLLALSAGPGRAAVVTFACLFGAGAGLATLLRASMLAELYGIERYGRIGGVVSLFTTVGRAAGPVLAAVALTASGSYGLVLAGLALLLVAAIAITLRNDPATSPATATREARRNAFERGSQEMSDLHLRL